MVIQGNSAAWIALYRTQGNAYWTLSGLALAVGLLNLLTTDFKSDVRAITKCYETI